MEGIFVEIKTRFKILLINSNNIVRNVRESKQSLLEIQQRIETFRTSVQRYSEFLNQVASTPQIHIRNFNSCPFHEKILQIICKKWIRFALNIEKSQLSDNFLAFTNERLSFIDDATFYHCKIGDRTGVLLKNSGFQSIKQLSIITDPISNKGYKSLMQLEFPFLESLQIENTNMTTDCMNVHTKWLCSETLDLCLIVRKVNYSMVIRKALNSSNTLIQLNITPIEEDCQHYMLINYSSKISLLHKYFWDLEIIDQRGYQRQTLKEVLMIPKRTLNILRELIVIKNK